MIFSKNIKVNKVDANRLKAEAYFNSLTANNNNTVGNINSSSEYSFWTFNRLKILCSIVLIVVMAYLVDILFPPSPGPLYALLGYAYILTPAIGALAKRPPVKKIKKTLFIKMPSRIYKSKEVPAFLPIISAFSMILLPAVVTIFNLKGSDIGVVGFIFIPLTPFITYNILCFIGDHPLSIWKAYRYTYKPGRGNNNSLFDDQGYAHGTSSGGVNAHSNDYLEESITSITHTSNFWRYDRDY